jgi:hypothetical protein
MQKCGIARHFWQWLFSELLITVARKGVQATAEV